MLSYLLLLLGAYKLLKILNSAYLKLLYPTLRSLFHALFLNKQRLLASPQHNESKWALIYGATNNIGQCAAKVLAKHGYGLILVDSNLDKLQKMQDDIGRVVPIARDAEGNTTHKILLLNINFAIWKDSTSLEYKIREVVTLDKNICVFINAISFLNPWQVVDDKLFHEVQFD